MKNKLLRHLARKAVVRIAAAATIIAAGIGALLLLVYTQDNDSGGSQTLTSEAASPTRSTAQTTGDAIRAEYLASLRGLFVSLPQPDGLTVDRPLTSGEIEVYAFYQASTEPQELLAFYTRELTALGWRHETPFASVVPKTTLEANSATYLRFVKDDLALTIGASPDASGSRGSGSRLLIDIAPRGGANPPEQLLDVFNSLPAPAGLTVDEPPRTTGINLQAFFWAKDEPEQVLAVYNEALVAAGWQAETLSHAEHGSVSSKFVNNDLRITVSVSPNEKAPIYRAARLAIDIRPKSEP